MVEDYHVIPIIKCSLGLNPIFITSEYTMQKLISFIPFLQHFTCANSTFNDFLASVLIELNCLTFKSFLTILSDVSHNVSSSSSCLGIDLILSNFTALFSFGVRCQIHRSYTYEQLLSLTATSAIILQVID